VKADGCAADNIPVVRLPRCAAAWVVLAAAGVYAVLLALAERAVRAGGERGAARAVRLAPLDARYWRELGVRRPDGRTELARALELNPRDAQAWVEAGLRAEWAGDFGEAERKLLNAARVDRTWRPAWALANFYFRRQEKEAFWRWARRCGELNPAEVAPLAELCWRVEPRPARLLQVTGPRREALAFAYRRTDPRECWPLAEALLASAAASAKVLLEYCDRLLAVPQGVPLALRLWDELAARGLLGRTSTGRGFDWRVNQLEGLDSREREGRLRLALSRQRPERCEIAWRYAAVRSGRGAAFRYKYEAKGLGERSGVYWRVIEAYTGEILGASADLTGGGEGSVEFPAPAAGLVKIALAYERRPGTVTSEAEIAWNYAQVRVSDQ
jgi:hypothetical protein